MFWGYLTVIGGMSMHLFIGNLYLWGNIEGYLISYFHYDLDGKPGDSSATFSSGSIILPITFFW